MSIYMNKYTIKWTRLQLEIFRFFCFKAGQKFNVREVARALKVSPTTVSLALPELEKERLLKVVKSKEINLFSIELNRNAIKTIELKRVENLKMIYQSEVVEFFFEEFPGCTIILFGSYAKGEDVWIGDSKENRSDIDIAIIGTKGKSIDLKKFEMYLERTISTHYYESWDIIHKYLKENIFNGIILKGGIEL